MKDYLNTEERNQYLILAAFIQNLKGRRSQNNTPTFVTMAEEWKKRNNLTGEESKALKTAITLLTKFTDSVYARMHFKEKQAINKKLDKFDFRLVDDFTLQKIYREANDRMVNAAVKREDFEKWCEEIMHCNCSGCSKEWSSCSLYNVFDDNFIPESSWCKATCKYSYGEGVKENGE